MSVLVLTSTPHQITVNREASLSKTALKRSAVCIKSILCRQFVADGSCAEQSNKSSLKCSMRNKQCRCPGVQHVMWCGLCTGVLGRCWTLGMWSCTFLLRTSASIMILKAFTAQPRKFHCHSFQSSVQALTGQASCARSVPQWMMLGQPCGNLATSRIKILKAIVFFA